MIDGIAKKLNITHVQMSPHNFSKSINNFEKSSLVNQSGLIIYTSGTTGRPKGALHTFYSLNSQVEIVIMKLCLPAVCFFLILFMCDLLRLRANCKCN